jgi:hypothetical protein
MAQNSVNNTVTSINEPGGSENFLLWITVIYPFFIIILSVTCRSKVSSVIESLPLAESASPGTRDDSPTGGKANPCVDDGANSNNPAEKPRTESMDALEVTQKSLPKHPAGRISLQVSKNRGKPPSRSQGRGPPATIKYRLSKQAFSMLW